MLVVNFGIENFKDLIFEFSFNLNWWQRWLCLVQNGIWKTGFQLEHMEDRVQGLESLQKTEGEGMGASLGQ